MLAKNVDNILEFLRPNPTLGFCQHEIVNLSEGSTSPYSRMSSKFKGIESPRKYV